MQNQAGTVFQALTNPFGYYSLENIPAGNTYLVSVEHKRFEFDPRTVTISDNLTGLDFVDVAGCRALARWAAGLDPGSVSVEVVGASSLLRRMWDLLHLGRLAPITFAEALA